MTPNTYLTYHVVRSCSECLQGAMNAVLDELDSMGNVKAEPVREQLLGIEGGTCPHHQGTAYGGLYVVLFVLQNTAKPE